MRIVIHPAIRYGNPERTLTDVGYIQDGEPYFYIKDYQGNVRAVLNQQNQVVELTSYYPNGGIMAATATEDVQPYKYGTKELDRQNGLDLYDSQARFYDSQTGRTTTQDPLAEKYPHLTPYLWCAANPISFTDPSGSTIILSGNATDIALEQLQKKVGAGITLSINKDNSMSYELVQGKRTNKSARQVMDMIDDANITVDIKTTDTYLTSNGRLFVGGAFMGNNVELDENGAVIKTTAFQEINPLVLDKMDSFSDMGTSILHEVTEAYNGAKISSDNKTSSPLSSHPNSVYDEAHKRATYQPKVYERIYDKEGNQISSYSNAANVIWYIKSNIEPFLEKIIQKYP